MTNIFEKSHFIKSFIKEWKLKTTVFIIIVILLSILQIYAMQKDAIFSIFHSILIGALIAI